MSSLYLRRELFAFAQMVHFHHSGSLLPRPFWTHGDLAQENISVGQACG